MRKVFVIDLKTRHLIF